MKRDNVEQQRVRGRNHQEVVQQLVETFNSANGWALVRVAANPITMEVFLERNANQVGNSNEETKEVDAAIQEKEADKSKEKPSEEEKPTKSKSETQPSESSGKEEEGEEASEGAAPKKRAATKKSASK